MSDKNYYEILGIDKNASEQDIKAAYRKLASKWHPDRFANEPDDKKKEAEEKFKEINEANAVLSDPKKKQMYDQFGTTEAPNGGFDPFDGFDPFENFNPFGHDPFGRQQRKRVEKGRDAKVVVKITLEEAYKGCEKEIKYVIQRPCSHCNGTGSEDGKTHECPHCHGTGRLTSQSIRNGIQWMQQTTCPFCHGTGQAEASKPCTKCHGTGVEEKTVTKKVTIPSGVETNNYLTIEGEGHEPKSKDGINGDLYVVIEVIPSVKFERKGIDLLTKLDLTLYEAWCGCKKTIDCIDGSKIEITIPELSEDKKMLRVQHKGMPDLRGYSTYGDMYVQVNYKIPTKLTDKQKKLLKEIYE